VGLPISEGLPTGAYTQVFDDAGLDSLGMDRRPAPRRWLRRTPQDRSDALEARNGACRSRPMPRAEPWKARDARLGATIGCMSRSWWSCRGGRAGPGA
ncbi:MAG TPA: hypothetical protein PLY24_07040, partial [Methanomassiliicoccales archaeon]|nr:hypothetical protein [Methanomassiliicoccales archaeon]